MSPHSPESNCEDDGLSGLDNLKQFVIGAREMKEIPDEFPYYAVPKEPENLSIYNRGKLGYLAGYVAKRLLKVVGTCKQCRTDLIESGEDKTHTEHVFIQSRAYGPKMLTCPSTNFNKLFRIAIHILGYILPKICYKDNVKFILQQNIINNINLENMFHCENHDILSSFTSFICNFHIFTWCKNVNKILKGKDQSNNYTDVIKLKARKKYEVTRKACLKIRSMKNLV